ncbi:Copper transport outer membrane protein, MctB [Alkalithermobacter thermoalcaliphilus JW-YL-7 = DSM 7308]|uniref:Copper transport outer membrane protein, MctB n=1 Tax=Alkalithermobacter thermoalcaliphilus JW-YL-7 = DSM 7308 TaxID=1121328 RepID=A0A150FPW3_CLOPD|nr:Protein of unknown function DUF3186 [[Clostridium] paradoxum JW-YL-7 = DSM 7308]SHK65791.1 Copper transport outer membrane protein, MctB [[Clostridium] paradoxum JW-YL-7 = DSM 7308]
MSINMKYYIVTISAIFISLGIGILIGFNLNTDGLIQEQQGQIIQRLEERFQNIKNENEMLENRILNLSRKNDKLNKYIETTYNYVIDNKIEGKKVGIIQTTEDYFYTNTKEFIQSAGGKVYFEIILKDNLLDVSDFSTFDGQINSKEELVLYILRHIYEEKNLDNLIKLRDKGMIDIKNIDLEFENLDYVIIQGGSIHNNEGKIELFDKKIIEYFKDKNVSLVGTERSDVEISYIPFYKKSKISTVDNIDEVTGKISLVMVLKGNKGHFGEKDTATDFMPFELK